MEKDWEEVFITVHEYRASLAKGILENESIEAVILNQHDSAIKSFGEYKLFVKKEDALRAKELLKELKN